MTRNRGARRPRPQDQQTRIHESRRSVQLTNSLIHKFTNSLIDKVLSVVNEKSRFNEQSKATKRKPTKEYVRIYKQIMQNKPNFENDKMNITLDITSNYEILPRLERPKNKPNSNPIQSQFNPKQTQFKPISKPNKPNSQKAKYDFLAEFTTLKGANFKCPGEFYLQWENFMLASAVTNHIITVRNILNCNDRVAKPWSKITLDNPESASRPTFRIIPLVLPVLSKERFMHGDSDESLCLS